MKYRNSSTLTQLEPPAPNPHPPVTNFGELKTLIELVQKVAYSAGGDERLDDIAVQQMVRVGEFLADEAEKRANLLEGSENYSENREKLKQANIEVLKEVRQLGGALNHETSSDEASTVLKRTVQSHYPSDWIEMSNSASPFVTKISENPAYKRELSTEAEGGELSTRQLTATYRFGSKEEAQKFSEYFSSETQIMETFDGEKMVYLLAVKYDHAELYSPETGPPMMGGRPVGKGWVKQVTPLVLGTEQFANAKSDAERVKLLSQPRWVKPEPRFIKRSLNIISKDDPFLENVKDKDYAVDAIAYHEFGHRMEEVIPNNALPRMEEAFLRVRTGKSVTSFYSNMMFEPSTGSVFHNAGFVDKYVGREYGNGNYEVFTTGVEAVLGKSYGGLSGQSETYSEADRQHKAFTLGVLASL